MPPTYTYPELTALIQGADFETLCIILWLIEDENRRYTLQELEQLFAMVRCEMGLMVGSLISELGVLFFVNLPKG